MSHSRTSSRYRFWLQALLAGLGSALTIGIIIGVTETAHLPLLLGSFGSSAVLIFGFPDSGFSKPARVVSAHVLCAAIGLVFLHSCGPDWTFLLWPTLLGSLTLVALASIWQKLFPKPNHHT